MRWRPDTCGCELEFSIPKNESGKPVDWCDPHVEVLKISTCHRHANLDEGAVFYHVWLQENSVINQMITFIKDSVDADFAYNPSVLIDMGILSFSENSIHFKVQFDADSIKKIQSHADSQWGNGRVVVEQ